MRKKTERFLWVNGILLGVVTTAIFMDYQTKKVELERRERLQDVTEEFDTLMDVIIDKVQKRNMKEE
jgi:hypothetical protein